TPTGRVASTADGESVFPPVTWPPTAAHPARPAARVASTHALPTLVVVMARGLRRGRRGRQEGSAQRPAAPVEHELPLLLEGLRPFAAVLGHRHRHADLHLLLERRRVVEVAAREDGLLDRLHGERAGLHDV